MNPLIESINSELPKFNAIDPENHIKTGLNQKLNLMLTVNLMNLKNKFKTNKITS